MADHEDDGWARNFISLVARHPQAPVKPVTPETTPLDPEAEQAFQAWATTNAPDAAEPDTHYDYRGYWQATKGAPRPAGHLPDTFKQHGHESFSAESQYSRGSQDGGQWLGDTLIAPPTASHTVTDTATGESRPVPMPSHLPPNPDGFIGAAPTPLERAQARERRTKVRAPTPTEQADARKRERLTLPWKDTDYTEPMMTIPQLGGMRIPVSGSGWFDPTAVMTTDIPGGVPIKGVFSRIERHVVPQVTVPTHPNRILSLMSGRAAPEEAEARGLTAWLKEKARGNQKVTPVELQDFLATHPLDVRETHYGAGGPRSILDIDPNDLGAHESPPPAKWARPDLNLPGGENYREIVLHTPPTYAAQERRIAIAKAAGARNGRTVGEYPITDVNQGYVTLTPEEQREWDVLKQDRTPPPATYTSHAFPEKNILAWLRMDDRTLANGDPISLIQEGQSDWHQAGRAQGYHNPAKSAEELKGLQKQYDDLEAAHGQAIRARRAANQAMEAKYQEVGHAATGRDNLYGASDKEFDAWSAAVDNHPEVQRLRAAAKKASTDVDAISRHRAELHEPMERLRAGRGLVPDAPFKGTGWQELAFNRAVTDAVERGKKGLAWTTGAQQSERYGKLMKGIKRIEWDRAGKSLKIWTGEHEGQGYNGPYRIPPAQDFNAATPEAVEAVIGKDATKRLMAEDNLTVAAGHAFSGTKTYVLDTSAEPLSIGSKGMVQQYDTNWVNHANKLGKPFGTAVKDVDIGAGTSSFSVRPTPNGLYAVWEDRVNDNPILHGKYDNEAGAVRQMRILEQSGRHLVHYLPFPPEFLAHVKGGLPIMSDPFGVGTALEFARSHPRAASSVAGAAVGGNAGAEADPDHPVRGALAGAVAGAGVGYAAGRLSGPSQPTVRATRLRLEARAKQRVVPLNLPASVESYHRQFGNYISSDLAKTIVSPESDRSGVGRRLYQTKAVHDASVKLMEATLARQLGTPAPPGSRALILLGPAGAGKSTAYALVKHHYDLALEMAGGRRLAERIEQMQRAGYRTDVVYVDRDLRDSWQNGVLSPQRVAHGRLPSLTYFLQSATEGPGNFVRQSGRADRAVIYQNSQFTSDPAAFAALGRREYNLAEHRAQLEADTHALVHKRGYTGATRAAVRDTLRH